MKGYVTRGARRSSRGYTSAGGRTGRGPWFCAPRWGAVPGPWGCASCIRPPGVCWCGRWMGGWRSGLDDYALVPRVRGNGASGLMAAVFGFAAAAAAAFAAVDFAGAFAPRIGAGGIRAAADAFARA